MINPNITHFKTRFAAGITDAEVRPLLEVLAPQPLTNLVLDGLLEGSASVFSDISQRFPQLTHLLLFQLQEARLGSRVLSLSHRPRTLPNWPPSFTFATSGGTLGNQYRRAGLFQRRPVLKRMLIKRMQMQITTRLQATQTKSLQCLPSAAWR